MDCPDFILAWHHVPKIRVLVTMHYLPLSESEALEELIHYIYKEKFMRTDPPHLLNILVASDKYQVNKVAKFCVESMLNSEITTESAILYLNCRVASEGMDSVKLLARNFLVKNFYQVAR